ncbi:phosphate ABC transporter substrate-binding protein PstS [Aquiluna sp. Uisw_065]|jgi:phosphate transport system substrate-binding protein|uniref:phosphate ABC transporter substrate-binding protein PstS n=1 Tax=Aquiluna sp. Uisw_065 TaxID=3230967 RepID=UPI0039E8653E
MYNILKLGALAAVSTLVLAGCAANEEVVETATSAASESTETVVELTGTLNGSGASSMAAGQEAWIAGFQIANPGVTVNYDPTGSGTGRAQFMDGATSFTGSDSYWKDEELLEAFPSCEAGTMPWEFPIWISPIAVIFNLDGISSLNMDGATVAGIFAGQITMWNDAAIAAANPGVALPDLQITAVHRSDESGTSKNFTDYLAKVAENVWTVGAIEAWPAEYKGESAPGTSGVVSAVTGANGTIGYADASRAGDLGTVAVKVGTDYVSYSAEAAAAVVDASPLVEGRESYDLATKIDRNTTASGAYPIVLVSYLMGCNDYADDAQAELVRAWASYLVSEEGQNAAAESAGNAPISAGLRAKAQAIIDAIK